jgi:tetratricopeptide (TPR) repeat protein
MTVFGEENEVIMENMDAIDSVSGDSDSDDSSVDISDVGSDDSSDDDSAPSTVASDAQDEDGIQLSDIEESDGEEADEVAPLEDDMVDREVEEEESDDDDEEESDDDDEDDDDDDEEEDEEEEDDDDEDEEDDEEDSALLVVNQDKFFERLNHFMDVQRKVEERMKKIDPEGRMAQIEVESHSKGIMEEDGSFKVKYQQQNAEGEPAQNLGEVYESAYQIKQALRDLLDKMVDKVKGLDYVDAKIVELKPRDRANEKAREEYLTRTPGPPEAWLYDILRSSVICKTKKQMESVNKFLSKKAHIVQVKNRFVDPAYSGYRDVLYHVLLDWPYKEKVGFVAEIQVHHKDVLNLEKMFGLQNHYNFFRSCFSGPNRSVIDTHRDLETIHKAEKMDDDLMGKILESEDPAQLFMFARMFKEKFQDNDRALQILSRVLTLQESSIGEIHPDTAATYQDIGAVQGKKGQFDNALRSLQKCLEIQEEVFGAYSPEVAITRSLLGHTIVLRGDDGDELMEHRGALQQYRKALVIRERCLGEDHLDVAASYQNIGESLCKLGDFQGALAAYRESLSILESLLGENHADVAMGHSLLGNVLYQQGDFQGAMEEYSIALAIREEVFGKTHQETANSHTEIGKLLAEVQDYEEAEVRHRKALRIRETVVSRESPEAAESHYWVGYVLNQKGNYSKALKAHKAAYAIRLKILTKKHPDTKASLRSIKANEKKKKE